MDRPTVARTPKTAGAAAPSGQDTRLNPNGFALVFQAAGQPWQQRPVLDARGRRPGRPVGPEGGLPPEPPRLDRGDPTGNRALQGYAGKMRGGIISLLPACAHANVVNTLEHIGAATGDARMHAVIGGMHLPAAGERGMAETAGQLSSMMIERLGFGHCTGCTATARPHHELPNRCSHCVAGTRIEFEEPAARKNGRRERSCLLLRPIGLLPRQEGGWGESCPSRIRRMA